MSRKILIEVEVEEVDALDEGYYYDPKMIYELTPVDYDLSGSIELVCRKSLLQSKLSRLDKRGQVRIGHSTSNKAIYGEPEEEVGALLKDAFNKAVTGFNIPAFDAIVDSIEEAVIPNKVRSRRKVNTRERDD